MRAQRKGQNQESDKGLKELRPKKHIRGNWVRATNNATGRNAATSHKSKSAAICRAR